MMYRGPSPAWGLVLISTWLGAGIAWAQPPVEHPEPEPTPPNLAPEQPTDAPALTEEDLRRIQESLAADAAEVPSQGAPVGQEDDSVLGTLGSVANAAVSAIQSMNPDLSFILDVALAYFSADPLQTGAHDPNQTGFTFQQLELSITTNVDPYFSFTGNLVFSQFGVEVEEAYGTTLALPWNLQLRAGQFLTRFGRINSTHPHTWAFLDQPLVVGTFFGGEGNRGLGLEVSWLASFLPWYVELVGSSHQANGDCCMRSYYGAQDLGVKELTDFVYTTALKQFFPFSDDWALYWGLSAQFGPNPTGPGNRTEIYGTDLYLRWRPVDDPDRMAVSLQAEGMFRTRQVPNEVLQDVGLYAQVVWDIDQRWSTGARYEYLSGLRGDYLGEPVPADRAPDRHRASAQITFRPSHFSRVRLQGNYDLPRYRTREIWAAMLNLELAIGAHGSHEY